MLFTNKHELHSCCTSIGTTQQYSTFIRKQHYRCIIILFIYTVQILQKYLSNDDNGINVRYMIYLVNLFDKQQHVSLVRVPIKHPTISKVSKILGISSQPISFDSSTMRVIGFTLSYSCAKQQRVQLFFLRLQWPKHYFHGN